MKNKILLISCFLIWTSITLFAQKETRMVDPFTKVSVLGNLEVDLVKSDSFKVVIDCKGGDLEQIATFAEDDELKIQMLSDMFSDAVVVIRIHHKELTGIEAKGGANIGTDMLLETERLTLFAGGGGKIELYNVKCQTIDAKASNGSTIMLEGITQRQNVDISSKAAYDAFELESENAYVDAAMKGTVKITVTKYLEAKATSKGYIGYRGSPEKIDEMATLGGQIVEDTGEEEE